MKKKMVNILIFYGEKSGARMPLITTPARAYIALACRASERGLAAMAGIIRHDWPERIHGAGNGRIDKHNWLLVMGQLGRRGDERDIGKR